MDMVSYKWLREIDMKVIGQQVKKMDKVQKFINHQDIISLLMEISMKDSSKMEIDREKANIHGLIKAIIKVNGYVIK